MIILNSDILLSFNVVCRDLVIKYLITDCNYIVEIYSRELENILTKFQNVILIF